MLENILEICLEAKQRFNCQNESIDDYIAKFAKQHKNLSERNLVFVTEILAGCEQQSNVLNTVLYGYFQKGANDTDLDIHVYSILLYLLIFRFDEIKLSQFTKLIKNQNLPKLLRFLKFFLDDGNFNTWIKEKWCKYYVESYVQEKLMKPLLCHKEDLDSFVNDLDDKINNRKILKLEKNPLTQQKPFNLTKLKPITVSLPYITSLYSRPKFKWLSVAYMNRKPPDKTMLEHIKTKNFEKAVLEQQKANENLFNCAKAGKSSKTESTILRLKAKQDEELKFDMKHRKEIPEEATHPKPINMTSAAILRDAALFLKEQKEKSNKLANVATGKLDSSTFLRNRRLELLKEKEQQQTEVNRIWIQSKIHREGAMLAKQVKIKKNRENVRKFKEDEEKMTQECEKALKVENDRLKKVVQEAQSYRESMQEAIRKTHIQKRKIALKVKKTSQKMVTSFREPANFQLQSKSVVLRRLHSLKDGRKKIFDDTSVPKHSEIFGTSYAEVKERLYRLKERQRQEIDDKRDSILEEKREKTKALMAAVDLAKSHRSAIIQVAKQREEDAHIELRSLQHKVVSDED